MIAAVPEGAGPYLALAILTFALHALAIGFVVAGTAVVALAAARGRADAPIAAVTRDWLPFALGLGITAGVAPLLFVQLLYQPRFYTANLILFVRWLAIVPALIVGFYALYLGKTARVHAWSRRRRAALDLVALVGFVFVGWSWIENHALALASPTTWAAQYQAASLRYADPAIAPRLVLWLGAAAAVWPAGVLVIMRPSASAARGLAAVATVGVAVAIAGGAWWAGAVEGPTAVSTLATPWLIAAAVLSMLAVALWWWALRRGGGLRAAIVGATAGAMLAWAVAREASRVTAIDPRLAARVAAAGGVVTFVISLAIGAAAITWCLRLVRRAAPPT